MTITLKGVFCFFAAIFYLCLAAFFVAVMTYVNYVPKEEMQWIHSWARTCSIAGLAIQGLVGFISMGIYCESKSIG